ncbi:MAG: ABC transporter permease [Ignavibacteria bacterium]|nr:ABC transporter permease [Ignavibacteria bacterium]
MEQLFFPKDKDIDYCLFFKDGNIPDNIYQKIKQAIETEDYKPIDSMESKQVSSWDILNISVQFNVFLILMILLTIIVIVTLVTLINFNIQMIIYRKRKKQIGTLMSFGVNSWKISLMFILESILQLVISAVFAFIMAFIISLIAHQQIATGFQWKLCLFCCPARIGLIFYKV